MPAGLPIVTRASLAALGFALLVLAACSRGPGDSPASELAAAKSLLAAKKNNDAVVRLKALLQVEPRSAEARLLLGQALLSLGNAKEAVVELRKAVELNSPDAEAIPLLARAMLEAQQHRALIKELGAIELPDAQGQARLSAMVGLAYMRDGDLAKAAAHINQAMETVPRHAQVLMAKARLLGATGKASEALPLTEEATKLEPQSAEAWMLKADLMLLGLRDRNAAAEAYKKVLEIQPGHLVAHMTLFGLAAVSQDVAAMRHRQQAMAKVAPNHPQTLFAEAQLAAVENDFKRAKELNDRTLKYFSENALMLQFAGWVELNLGSLVQAENYLAKAVQQSPRLRSARHMLASVYLRTDQPAKAIEVLKPTLQGTRPDFIGHALTAQAHLMLGDARTAEQLFVQSAKIKPEDPQVRTSLALLRLGRGEVGLAFDDLRAAASASTDAVPDLALVSAHLRRNDFTGALGAIDNLQKKAPKNPLADLLRARALLALKRMAEARRSLEDALAKDPQYLPAAAGLATIDLLEKRPADAERRFAEVLRINPKNFSAQLALADLKARSGAPRDEVVKLLESVVKVHPDEPGGRLALVRYLTSSGEKSAAMAAALAANAALPENIDVAMTLGELQLRGGEHQQAVGTLGRVAARMPKSAAVQLLLGEAQLAARDYVGAERSAKKAIELSPKSSSGYRSLVAVYMVQSKPPLALQAARDWQRVSPKDPLGYQWEGDILAELKEEEAALKAYRRGMAQTAGGTLPERTYSLLERTRGKDDAQRFAADWQKRHPRDIGLPLFLGNTAVVKRDYQAAVEHFSEAVRIQPENGVALNNLAWSSAQLGKPEAAGFAERAVATAPENRSFADTLAIALAAGKQYPRAIEVAKSNRSRAPNDLNTWLTLADVYALAGERTLALNEVTEIEKRASQLRDKQRLQDLKARLAR